MNIKTQQSTFITHPVNSYFTLIIAPIYIHRIIVFYIAPARRRVTATLSTSYTLFLRNLKCNKFHMQRSYAIINALYKIPKYKNFHPRLFTTRQALF